ncbi:hypothetical protein CPB86DRAFT_782577 [Serendipita vermifera]|nr:hypothetical protein CPB86DRAFT_782577 [Serendipita vermifera]
MNPSALRLVLIRFLHRLRRGRLLVLVLINACVRVLFGLGLIMMGQENGCQRSQSAEAVSYRD